MLDITTAVGSSLSKKQPALGIVYLAKTAPVEAEVAILEYL